MNDNHQRNRNNIVNRYINRKKSNEGTKGIKEKKGNQGMGSDTFG